MGFLPPSPPPNFSPVTSTNVAISPQNFLTFRFCHTGVTCRFAPSASPKLLNLNQEHPSKKRFFWSNPYKIEVAITSLIEMLELPNFGHMNVSTIKLISHDKILLVTSSTGILTS